MLRAARPIACRPSWTYQARAALWAGPVVADRVAYVGDAAGKFHAVNVATGRAHWTFDAGAPLFGAAAVAGDAVYFVSDNGRLYRLARADGRELWRVDLGGGGTRSVPSRGGAEWDCTAATPVLADDAVLVGSAEGAFQARIAANGKLLWSFKTGGKIRGAAVIAGEVVVVGSTDHFVYALDRRTGAPRWRFDTGSPVTTAPLLAGNRIVIGTRDRALLYALDAATGAKLWAVDYWFSWVESTPVLADGLLYVGSSDSRRVRVIEPETGRVRWAAQVWGWTWGTPLVVGNTVYYGTAGAQNISSRSGLRWERSTAGPARSNGANRFRCWRRVTSRGSPVPWPMPTAGSSSPVSTARSPPTISRLSLRRNRHREPVSACRQEPAPSTARSSRQRQREGEPGALT